MPFTPKVMHALLSEDDVPLVPGRSYDTLCGTTWEHQVVSAEDARTRFVCAMCHDKQMAELLAAFEHLRGRYNYHLEHYHLVADEEGVSTRSP